MKLIDLFEHRWWEFAPTVTLYHGTTSGLLPDIQAHGLMPPKDFDAFALAVRDRLLAEAERRYGPLPDDTRRAIVSSVADAIAYRTGINTDYAAAVYLSPNPELAAGYARTLAQHGGELVADITDRVNAYLEVWGKPHLPPRFPTAYPVVLEVEIPYEWVRTKGLDLAAQARHSRQDWEDGDREADTFEAHMEASGDFEVFVRRAIPPAMIRAITRPAPSPER